MYATLTATNYSGKESSKICEWGCWLLWWGRWDLNLDFGAMLREFIARVSFYAATFPFSSPKADLAGDQKYESKSSQLSLLWATYA
jgi:hypothetical protein